MNFFKQLKSKLLGSVKADLNSALGARQQLFNSKIAGALDDLISMKTGIQISNVPQDISAESLISAEDRRAVQKSTSDSFGVGSRSTTKPNDRTVLKFPSDDNRFVDNWILFRTIPKTYSAQPYIPDVIDGSAVDGDSANVLQAGRKYAAAHGFSSITSKKAVMDEYTIALYFPNNVKDTVSVDYETKDIGLSDIAIDNLLNNFDAPSLKEAGGMISEMYRKAKQEMINFESFQTGKVVSNPKFNTFSGVSFREHSYQFNLNPYNVNDAEQITHMIHAFKTLMLPMSSQENRRNMLMPAEWSIDFKGPILGHIEHPQNCFLKTCDVDYSGGKDMSFIETFSKSKTIEDDPETKDTDESLGSRSATSQHYPNGVSLSLVFTEILNIDRLRYVDRVSPFARGKAQDVDNEIENFEKVFQDQGDKTIKEATDFDDKAHPLSRETTTTPTDDPNINYRAPDGSIIGRDANGNTTILYSPPPGRG